MNIEVDMIKTVGGPDFVDTSVSHFNSAQHVVSGFISTPTLRSVVWQASQTAAAGTAARH